jgi:hypothetical protein
MKNDAPHSFETADKEKQASLLSEALQFLRQNKKYWLIPILLLLLVLGALVILGGTAAAPFIYSLF